VSRAIAIANMCRECIADDLAAGTWTQQVAACCCTDCPLWRYRPLPRSAPAWLASHRADDLPAGFASLSHDDAIAEVRRRTDAKADSASPRLQNRTRKGRAATTPPEREGIADCARTAAGRR